MFAAFKMGLVSASGGGSIELVGVTSAKMTSTGWSATVPAGASDGDLLIACVAASSAQTNTLPAGWTKWAEKTTACSGLVAYLTITGAAPSTVSFAGSSNANRSGALVLLRNAEIDAIGTFGTGTPSQNNVPAPAITSSGGQSFALYGVAGTMTTLGTSSGMVSLVNDLGPPAFSLCHNPNQEAGTTGSRSINATTSVSISKFGIQFCVKKKV